MVSNNHQEFWLIDEIGISINIIIYNNMAEFCDPVPCFWRNDDVWKFYNFFYSPEFAHFTLSVWMDIRGLIHFENNIIL